MKSIDIEGKLHLSSRERWIILLSSMGILAISILSNRWFVNYIPIRFLQLLWAIPTGIVAISCLGSIIWVINPKKADWIAKLLTAFWG